MDNHLRPRALRRPLLLALLLTTLAALGSVLARAPGPAPRVVATPHPQEPESSSGQEDPGDWEEVDRLIGEDKYREALERVERLRQEAREAGNEEDATRALLAATQLRIGLHGYETAVRSLHEAPWPQSFPHRVIVPLFYAQSLVTYFRAYSWEIRQRERVDTGDEVDLKAWTTEQIYAEAQRAYHEIWGEREEWGSESLGTLGEFIEQNNYPARIRGTLRDAATYLWVELLADTSLWSPRHSNEIHLRSLERLSEGGPERFAEVDLVDPDTHPLVKLAAILADLEAWHLRSGRPEAAFEARRERLERLRGSFSQPADREALLETLEERLEALGRRYPWWSMGMATRAEQVRQTGEADAEIRAREIALRGERAHPNSPGGRRCRHIVASIEAPSYHLRAMSHDGARRPSIVVSHRNLERLHFRAWAVDLVDFVESAQDYNLLPDHREIPEVLRAQDPVAEWSVELPPTPDYRQHQTFVTPPMERPGLYVVLASARRDFEPSRNLRYALDLVIGDLVLLTQPREGGVEVTARSGRTGEPQPGASIDLYRYDWQQGHRRVRTVETGNDGTVLVPISERRNHFLVGRHGEDVVLDQSSAYPYTPPRPSEHTHALLYTDRSVYRPQHEVQFKVVAYRGGGEESRFRTLPGREVTVELVDPNGQVAASDELTTNDFGSASGALVVPPGRILGQWHLRSSLGGQAPLRVEEYKRPTFEVTISDPEGSLRLNEEAAVSGEVRYYFGLPVTSGAVSWRVVREPRYPHWWSWYGYPTLGSQTVDAGKTRLDDEGRFELSFLPEADERLADSGVTYSYRLEVDVTDEGGETRSASRVFRLGFVGVEAALTSEATFFLEDEPLVVDIRRTDLDGVARPGPGRWELVALRQPAETLLPAEQPLPPPPGDPEASRFATPGDRKRARWDPRYNPQAVLRQWEDGEEIARGRVEHGEDGTARLELGPLSPGPYRLRYTTEDRRGATFETTKELVVASDGSTRLALPALFLAQHSAVPVGETARLLVHSGLENQPMILDLFRWGRRIERRVLSSGEGLHIVEIPVEETDRGGFGATLTALRDHQVMHLQDSVFVPWDDRELEVSFSTFRDRLRPGQEETWRVTVRGHEERLAPGAAELLAYMYDRSLDVFAPHQPPSPLDLYPTLTNTLVTRASLGSSHPAWQDSRGFASLPGYPVLRGDRLQLLSGYGIGGLGNRFMRKMAAPMAHMRSRVGPAAMADAAPAEMALAAEGRAESPEVAEEIVVDAVEAEPSPGEGEALRTDFSETAFWSPHLLLEEDGAVSFSFEVPDSVTEWNVWVHAVTTDLRGGSTTRRTRSVKELMVRPYVPRFLREGDHAVLEVVVNNAGEETLEGSLRFQILDPDTEEDLSASFGLASGGEVADFSVGPGGGTDLGFSLSAPTRVGPAAIRVVGTAGDWSDGELRPVPVLPGRVHLSQSRFATLHDRDRHALRFEDLAAGDDPSLRNDQLVVTLDAQLFYSVLHALPYLVEYPYECTEQTLNRFLSTGIVTSLYDDYPAVARMAEEFSRRETRYEAWDRGDPNRKMVLEETPWLREAGGGTEEDLVNVLDPRVARAHRESALTELREAQTSLGAFPWWPGGPPSPYMTLYILNGFSRALEFGVEVPRDLVTRAWSYMHRHYVDELVRHAMAEDCCWEMVTFLNYVLSSYPDESWTGGVFTAEERRTMLEFSFRHWREHSPLLKAQLALTLERADRPEDATLVFDSVMDSSQTTEDQGTFWAPEDRAWLWYNDTIEGHSFALRTLTELDPDDARRHGLVQWLLLNKKLNHWKSTRATAEVIYALTHYLEQEGALGVEERATVEVGPLTETYTFAPDSYTGKKTQLVVPGSEVEPAMATVEVAKDTPGFLFASATWHFSTERLPEEAEGNFFSVTRRYFLRVHDGDEWTLQPLGDGVQIETGDQVEVHLSIRAKHAAEYVHLRDPRPAGFEPQSTKSRYRWDLGLGRYEEIRDSGMNFFFDWLPAGEYTLKHRLRATMTGTFRVSPATLQSMYAPEFTAYSTGTHLQIR